MPLAIDPLIRLHGISKVFHADEVETRLPEHVDERRHLRAPRARAPRSRRQLAERRLRRVPAVLRSDVRHVEVEAPVVVDVGDVRAHAGAVRQRP